MQLTMLQINTSCSFKRKSYYAPSQLAPHNKEMRPERRSKDMRYRRMLLEEQKKCGKMILSMFPPHTKRHAQSLICQGEGPVAYDNAFPICVP
ncbi:unnamed protein product [Prunus armeniaca]|uniref:Uncharacterized protein n=1 Tax=Prunus armeniaca TaxID=36596 RepID=A0A6J5TG37_PRUAR|nr:unnamed protein product [Prunus armeniaca]CAB4293442.1 unnamed protein product [Prunus armeniaca]